MLRVVKKSFSNGVDNVLKKDEIYFARAGNYDLVKGFFALLVALSFFELKAQSVVCRS